MYKIFVPEPIPTIPLVAFLVEHLQEGNKLFQALSPQAYEGIFERVSDASAADIIVMPHEYLYLRRHPQYLSQWQERARGVRKLLLISAYQDDPHPIAIQGAIIIRPSAYRVSLNKDEILMPAYVEDVGKQWGREPLPKGTRPIVSFAGKAGFSGFKEQLQYAVRNYIVRHGPHKQGMYFRRHALAALAADPRIELNTIVRKYYSAHRRTVEVPLAQVREEYIRSIQGAHFILAPRGDGNYSLRFYETLSLGRIPILIDTDMPLPLQDYIDYDAFIVRVPWQDVDRIGDYIVRFFEGHSDTEFIEVQQKARNAFESYFFMPRFLSYLFTKILPERIPLFP